MERSDAATLRERGRHPGRRSHRRDNARPCGTATGARRDRRLRAQSFRIRPRHSGAALNGEAESGTIAPSGVDHVERLWQFRKVGHYPVYAIYGLDVVLVRARWLRQIVPFGLVTFAAAALTYGL